MIDSLKKTVLAGIGAAVVTREKVQENLDEFVKKGRLTADEARAAAEKIAGEGRREFERASAQLGDKLREFAAGIDGRYAERIGALEARVAQLEARTAKAPARTPKS